MQEFASSLVSVAFHGVAYGMILYVISVGLSVTMGLMGFINLAHGVFAMAGGYIFAAAMARFGAPFAVAVIAAFLGVAAASVVLERLLYSRLYRSGELAQVLFSIGLILVSMASARMIFGDQAARVLLPDYLRGQLHMLGRDFPTYRVVLIGISAVIIVLLWFGVERTRWGAMVRAAVDNRAMAQSVGINTSVLFMGTFALGSGLAGLGGALGADILPVQWGYPFEHLVYFLIVVAIGGLGSLRGPFIAALLIGVADTACKYWIPEFGAFLIYAATIAILLWRPMGLFGVRA
ncbi:MAG TPA: branched-chain amino acid ABC transporter permease [Burkholderiales bacterium]|nr:branched-chain amino acid ABC transporter permease [Burkholderiales bacterium]